MIEVDCSSEFRFHHETDNLGKSLHVGEKIRDSAVVTGKGISNDNLNPDLVGLNHSDLHLFLPVFSLGGFFLR